MLLASGGPVESTWIEKGVDGGGGHAVHCFITVTSPITIIQP